MNDNQANQLIELIKQQNQKMEDINRELREIKITLHKINKSTE